MIADDDPDIRELLSITFIRAGFTVVAAADGRAALRAAEQQLPDAVLADMDMPGLTGERLCLAMRAHPRLRTVPMAVLSGTLYPQDSRCQRAGACMVMLEPVANKDLVTAIKHLVATGPHGHRPDHECCATPARLRPAEFLAVTGG
ncbi:response regulator [Actinoplanes sichuanensis]|uniref:Response regulator n=1 Tax=Actinoplanes sichuanensis TaxID=512349 RepID=A0ABW4A184_9ACTN